MEESIIINIKEVKKKIVDVMVDHDGKCHST